MSFEDHIRWLQRCIFPKLKEIRRIRQEKSQRNAK